MGAKKTLGIICLIVGIIGLILSLIADPVGIGGSPGFGWKQIAGVIVGVILGIVGLLLSLKKQPSTTS
jgi:hypothetical protein